MSSNQLIATIVIVVTAVAVALMLDSKALPPREPPPSGWDSRMIELDKQALDQAYVDQLEHLFAVWMKGEEGQPTRAINGARQARRAYIEVMQEIKKREKGNAR